LAASAQHGEDLASDPESGVRPEPGPLTHPWIGEEARASRSKRCSASGISLATQALSVRAAPEESGQPVVQRSVGVHGHLRAEGPPALLVAAKLRLQALRGPV